jgi:LPS-assembly protein
LKSFSAIVLSAFFAVAALAQEAQPWEVQSLSQIIPGTVEGRVDYDLASGTAVGTNGVYVKYGNTTLTTDAASVNTKTGEVDADGHVRIESGDQLWVGEHVRYNFKTRQMRTEQFRTGKFPIFAGGTGLTGDGSNKVYTASRAFFTTDDTAEPGYEVRASRIKIIPGKSIEMWNAVMFVERVPVFYFPYFKRNLGERPNNFTLTPGYRSRYGAYFLNTYTWYLGDVADGKIHADYRERRGGAVGPDVNLHLGRWGEFALKYYYADDARPNISTNVFPQYGNIPENRQRFRFSWQATPATNLNLKALVNYQSDPLFVHDFSEADFSFDPQPGTFIEANKYWDNWSLDALATPRVNSFFNQVERLPDVRLTGFRQRVFDTPVYYDSESSAGYYRSFVSTATANTNGLYSSLNGTYAASAARADTYHQLTLPWTFFHWLNVTPRVGGRLTYYGSQNFTNGQPNSDVTRGVFNAGMGTSFKSSRLWTGATNSLLQVDGLRHVIEPSADYVYVPDPSTPPGQLPQFDAEQPSLLLLPLTFPDYNNIDSIDTQNVIRFGLRNTLQTMRDGQLDNLLSWNLLLDWRLDPKPGQSRWNDLYSAFAFKPRTWLTLESQTRYDLEGRNLNMALEQLTFAPNDRWSWGLGYWYLRNGTWGDGAWTENNLVTSTLFVRLGDNWGARMTHNYNLVSNRLQDQFYTLYRDLRSWTTAVTFRVSNNTGADTDFTIALVLSLKAAPIVGVGDDVVNRYHLVGE